ncbi:hypothetical protein [Roseivirga seohaensis]|uniref:hypothetical protein n=1 Tax=Roseivirga seohaensis TaxID=1914963 RepID=UPI003BACDDDF
MQQIRNNMPAFPVIMPDGGTYPIQPSALVTMMAQGAVLPIALENSTVLAHRDIITAFLQQGYLVPMLNTNGQVVLAKPAHLNGGLNGLFDIFKSKDRKEVESQLPELQSTVSSQSSQISQLTASLQALQNSLVQKDQVIAQLQQAGGLSMADKLKDPIVIGAIAFGVIGGAYGIYKAVKG